MKTIVFYIFIIALISFGCNKNQVTNNPPAAHSHDDVSIKITGYNNAYEVFAEASPFTTGKNSSILAHFTFLKNFKPLTEGKITASLIVGNKGIRQTLDQPIRTGIYKFTLQPGTKGIGKLIFDIESNGDKSTVTINNIEVFDNEHDAIHSAEEAIVPNPNAIAFLKEQSWKIDFATGLPSIEPFGQIIKTTAIAEPAQGDEIIITAKTSGIVLFQGKILTEGTSVIKNKSLFSISGKNLADNNIMIRFNEARNNYEKTKINFERNSKLAKDQIISKKRLLESKTEFENARLLFNNLEANFTENGQSVSSPVTGFIKHIHITNGEYVEAGQPIMIVAQNKNLFLKAEVQQKYASELPYIKSATIRSSISNKLFTLEELNGKIISYGKNISDRNYLIPITLQVESHDKIFPGSFVEIYLKSRSEEEILTLPNTALIEEQTNFAVFVQIDPENFEKREIKTGKTDGLKTIVLSGIKPTERIVTRGAILVKLAAVSNSLDPHAGHVH